MDPQKIRKKLGRFRALIVGRPNAGKTTILRCIARSADGRVDPSSGRGVHDIAEELVFSSNPGFVFHDSRGIEAGATNEMQIIQHFISERATARSLDKKLHAIWYCIPTDNARLVAAAELQFSDEIDPNGVPVILIFTKFESQEADAFSRLQETYSFDDALLKAPQEARQIFEKDHLSRFMDRKYPPKEVIYLKNMDREDAQCSEIIELTTKALNNDTLKWLLATVQEVNLRSRIEQILKSTFFKRSLNDYRMKKMREHVELAKSVWIWFPHIWFMSYLLHLHDLTKHVKNAISPLITKQFLWSNPIPYAPNINNDFLHVLYFVASLAIAAENSFWLPTKFPLNFKHAAKSFCNFTASISVSQQIQTVFQDKFPEYPVISEESQILLPLSEIIINNLLAHVK